jgi:integrase
MGYKPQAYLHKNRHGTFAFRWRPPRDIAIQFSQASFVYSLGTKESSIARGRALYASIRANQFVSILRAVKSSKEPTFNTELVRSVIMPDGTEHKFDYDPSKPEDVAEADRVLGALVRGENVSGSEFDNLQRTLEPSLRPSRVRGKTPVISAAFKAFCAEKRSTGAWKDADHSERYDYGPIIAELIEVAGDRPMGSLAIDHLRLFKERILADGTSPTNKAKKLGRLKSFLSWARDVEQITVVSTAILQLPKRKSEALHYEPFSDDDLQKLFGSTEYRDQSFAKASEFWIPLLGLYTGARINELAQLHVDDIGEHDGVTVLSINDEGDKRTKTPASTRKVPIHPRLVEAGLLEYHTLIHDEGWQRLFPELTKSKVDKNGYGKEPGKFFTHYRRAQGVSPEADRRKVFHSFRTTANSKLRFAQVPQERRERLIGHESDATNNKDYRPDDRDQMFPFARLLADLEMLDFGLKHPKYKAQRGHSIERLKAARRRTEKDAAEPGDAAGLAGGK